MFTGVLHNQPEHLFPQPHLQAGHTGSQRYGSYQQKVPFRKQYAYPQWTPQLYQDQTVTTNSRGSSHNASEHMLRRKTPNGTLMAGYDGRPEDWTTTRHATKHILMPVTSATLDTEPHILLRDSSTECFTPSRSRLNAARDDERQFQWQTNKMGYNCYENTRKGIGQRPVLHSLAGMDSVLDQGPPMLQHDNSAQDLQITTSLQPIWPSSFGSSSLGFPRVSSPYLSANALISDRSAPSQASSISGRNWRSDRLKDIPESSMASQVMRSLSELEDFASHSSSHRNRQDPISERHGLSTAQLQRASLPYRRRDIKDTGETPCSREITPLQLHSAVAQTAISKSTLESGSTHFKEQALTWAHRLYSNLLASMQQPRHSTTHGTSSSRQLQTRMYPKPPRQSLPKRTCESSPHSQNHENLKKPDGLLFGQRNLLPYFKDLEQQCSTLSNRPQNEDCPFSEQSHSPNHPDPPLKSNHSAIYLTPPAVYQLYGRDSRFPAIFNQHEPSLAKTANIALELLEQLCQESSSEWTEGMLLGGCLAFGLGQHAKAMELNMRILSRDPNNVEALSNLSVSLLTLNRREEAERRWIRCLELQPSYLDAVEHLVTLYCEDQRGKEAIKIIDQMCTALEIDRTPIALASLEISTNSIAETSLSTKHTDTEKLDCSNPYQRLSKERTVSNDNIPSCLGISGYAIPPSENGRVLGLIHGKGNMLYALGDSVGATKAFEEAILLGAGNRRLGIRGLIKQILRAFGNRDILNGGYTNENAAVEEPILLFPEAALQTSQFVFPPHGQLPGLKGITTGSARRAAVSVLSNCLLSLAKIYQDGMSSSGASADGLRATSGVQEILALYYLSLSLQPSPSTANNVGILLASVQQSSTSQMKTTHSVSEMPEIPGIAAGSGIALAYKYYKYGLGLDYRHAHLHTNLGSLYKDIGRLDAAIGAYEDAVKCDGNFDIALANLANAVKDKGRISEAINYYRRAVSSNPEFAEAVCGLANALNSVCSWTGRGGISYLEGKRDRWHVDAEGMIYDSKTSRCASSGWIERVVAIVEKQLRDGESWGKGILHSVGMKPLLRQLNSILLDDGLESQPSDFMTKTLQNWMEMPWEGAKVVRLVERATKRLGWQRYWDKFVRKKSSLRAIPLRPQLPPGLAIPSAPTVLPFHTFTCPLSAKQIRKISQRNGLRISCSTLRAPWLPSKLYELPSPPNPYLRVGYVSSDFNNHPLAHLMQSVFGFHDKTRVHAYCYATTASDGSIHRQQIERDAPKFYDASSWSIECLVTKIVEDGIHILVNLNGYTRGARNEVFAARPAPIQMTFMGFAGTLGAEWCDYLLADRIAVPPQTLRPWRRNVDLMDQALDKNNDDDDDWVYGENLIFTRDTFFCCDHRQSAPDAPGIQLNWADEQRRRWKMRQTLFPDLSDDVVILGNFNQLYKIEPTTFRTWLRILSRIPKAVLWLLRFPELGESNLKRTALQWVGSEVASRILFTDVAPKHQHISRARVCDLFLDTPECNAHTTAADVLWSGTPLLTFPRYEYKMCSRIATSILRSALPNTKEGEHAMRDLVVSSDEEYEEHAVELGLGLDYPVRTGTPGNGQGRLIELRKLLYENRWRSALFNTRRWVHDLETAYEKAWMQWVAGEGGDIYL